MKQIKIGLIGAFGFKEKYTGGQPVKSRNLYRLLAENFADDQIDYVETIGWKRRPLKHIWQVFSITRRAKTIIMLPAQNGLLLYSRLLPLFSKKRAKLIYCVIGGWLPEMVKKSPQLLRQLNKRFSYVWVETNNMQDVLIELGVNNVEVVSNFKYILPLAESEIKPAVIELPFKFCTFSRVLKEKGIEDAINAIKRINEKNKKEICRLDIYGAIDPTYENQFKRICDTMPNYIKYCGCVDSSSSVDTIKGYYMLLFPTYYEGEGFAGTLLDALAAGVPVIASDWRYNTEIITSDVGVIFAHKKVDSLVSAIEECVRTPQRINEMKLSCLKKADEYTPQHVVRQIIGMI